MRRSKILCIALSFAVGVQAFASDGAVIDSTARDATVVNVPAMLAGRISGVQVGTDGMPGTLPVVRVRGIGTFGDTSPLYVVDGIPIDISIIDLSPNDIETLEVLKDASAAALYGARAGNGVILITTRSGNKNGGMHMEYSGSVGFDTMRKGVYNVMNAGQYGAYARMIYGNSGRTVPHGYDMAHPDYLDPATNDSDWFDAMFKAGLRQNHDVRLYGGGRRGTYAASFDYYGQDGTMKGSGPGFRRYSTRMNTTLDLGFLNLSGGFFYSLSDKDIISESSLLYDSVGWDYPLIASAFLLPASLSADRADDDGIYRTDLHGYLDVLNPLALNKLYSGGVRRNRIALTGRADVDLLAMFGLRSLKHRLLYSVSLFADRFKSDCSVYVPNIMVDSWTAILQENTVAAKSGDAASERLLENRLVYEGGIGGHHINVMGGYSMTDKSWSETIESMFGRVEYDYDGRYFLAMTARRDGFRIDGDDVRQDWFPSMSAEWKSGCGLNLRASYGILGNYEDILSALEKKSVLDFGLDASVAKNKVEFSADWYRIRSYNLYMDPFSVPGALPGFSTIIGGRMQNSGIELSASYHNHDHEIEYDVSAHISHNVNKVISIGVDDEPRQCKYTRTEAGGEMGRFYGYVAEGIFQNWDQVDNHVNDAGMKVIQDGARPGDMAYMDLNNDGRITDEDRTYIGSGLPKVNFGLSFGLSYKKLDMNVLSYGATDFKVLDLIDMTLRQAYGVTNKSVEMLNAWTSDETFSSVPRAEVNDRGQDRFSQRFLQKGNYMKIANVEIGYRFSDALRIYVSGQNLAVLTKCRSYDLDFAGNSFAPGYNRCSYAAPRTVLLGVRMSF